MIEVTIVDYGSGNVLSAQQSFLKVAKDNNIKNRSNYRAGKKGT